MNDSKVSNEDRILILERMVKTLTETVSSLTQVVNTGSYEYSLDDVRLALRNVEEFTLPPKDNVKPVDQNMPPTIRGVRYPINNHKESIQCADAWHTSIVQSEPWCLTCGRSVR